LHRSFAAAMAFLAEGWDSSYRVAPIWRFRASRGVFGPGATMGVLCPSVDRVGRLFPALILAGDDGRTQRWFEHVENLLLDLFAARIASVEDFAERLNAPNMEHSFEAFPPEHLGRLDSLPIRMSEWWVGDDLVRSPQQMFSLPTSAGFLRFFGPVHVSPIATNADSSATLLAGDVNPLAVVESEERQTLIVIAWTRSPEELDGFLSSVAKAYNHTPALAELLASAQSLDEDLIGLDIDGARADARARCHAGVAIARLAGGGLSIAMAGRLRLAIRSKNGPSAQEIFKAPFAAEFRADSALHSLFIEVDDLHTTKDHTSIDTFVESTHRFRFGAFGASYGFACAS